MKEYSISTYRPIFIFLLLLLCYIHTKAQQISVSNGVRKFSFTQNTTTKDYIPGIIILKFKSTSIQTSANVNASNTTNVLGNIKGVTIESMVRKFPDLQKKANTTLSKLEDEFGFNLIHEIKYVSKLDIEAVINELLKNDQIEYAEPSYVHRMDYNPNDPSFLGGLQSYLQQVKAPAAWDITRNASNIIIGIVDSGSDLDHPDLAANIYLNAADPINGLDDDNDGYIDNYRGWDMTGASYVYGSKGDNDPNVKSTDNGHGVHVSGIASAVSNNNIGVASIAGNAKLLIVKCAADNEYNSLIYNGYEGILYAVDHGAKIINCSWGSNNYSNFGQFVINYAISKDCLIISSAGNDYSPYIRYPALYSGVISVANVDKNDKKFESSNYGTNISISAPGTSIYNTIFNNGYGYYTGTSMASPLVASAAALVKSYYPSYTMKQIGELLIATADNIDSKNPYYIGELGSGRLNVFKALGGKDPYPQVISFTMPLVKTYGDADFDPGASSSSGLPISYTSNNTSVATIINGKIRLMGIGSATITASQTGNLQYSSALDVSRLLTVNKTQQVISFTTPPVKIYGDADFDAGATSSSGLTVTYTSNNTSIAAIINGKIRVMGAGSATITASQSGNLQYSSALDVSRILTVNKAAQVISFTTPLVKTYGDADFDAGATSSSGLLVTYSSANPNIATIVNNKIHIIGAGTALITASQAGNSSFSAAPTVGRTLTVAKGSQTISFPNLNNKNYGDSDFDPGASSTSGLPISYTSSNTDIAIIINNKIHITGIGTTILTASQAGNTNYNPALSVNNTLTAVYPLPTNNFTVQANDKTCRATNNGTIIINTVQTLNYNVSVKGINQTTSYNFSNVLEIKDLSAGNYSVCITIPSVNNYKQCFDLTIREPKDLSVYANVSNDNKLVNLQLQGGTFYKIEMNNKTYTTNEQEIALPLINGTNTIKITTNTVCQGVIEKTFITNHKIIAYPNPFTNSLSINTGTMDDKKVNVQVYTRTGLLVYSGNHQNQMGKIDLDLSKLTRGLYILCLDMGNTHSTLKIIKN